MTIARAIYKNDSNKKLFRNLEEVRSSIRYYRGARGDKAREVRKLEKNITPKYNIPKSDAKPFNFYHVANQYKKGAVLSDLHFPYHDQKAIEIALEDIHNENVDFIILNGDIVDFHRLSRYNPDPRARDMKGELDMLNDFLDTLQKNFKGKKIIYKQGNHEERYDAYLISNAPEMYKLPEIHLNEILKLKERGIDWVTDKRIIKYSNLHIIHGHEYKGGVHSPVNPARGLFLKAKSNSLVGHHHRTSEHTEPTIKGDIITCWSCGCLADLHPLYMPLNNWNLGYSIVRNDEKHFFVDNKRIIDYKIV